jgi:hypothetical protein
LDDKYGDGGWRKADHWPRVDNDPKSKFVADNGLMPLWVPAVLLYLCDISHRVKVIGSMCYDIKKGKDPRPPPVIAVSDDEDDGEEEAAGQSQPKKKKKKAVSTQPKKKPWKDLTKEEQEHRTKNSMQKYDCEKIKVLGWLLPTWQQALTL